MVFDAFAEMQVDVGNCETDHVKKVLVDDVLKSSSVSKNFVIRKVKSFMHSLVQCLRNTFVFFTPSFAFLQLSLSEKLANSRKRLREKSQHCNRD